MRKRREMRRKLRKKMRRRKRREMRKKGGGGNRENLENEGCISSLAIVLHAEVNLNIA